jgi:peptide/nickel transport system permease protein
MMVQLSPGNPALLKLQEMQGAMGTDSIPEDIIEQTKKMYGLDKPLPERYWIWLKRLVKFDFGESFKDHRPVLTKILEALPITLQLNGISLLLIYGISIPVGIFSATHQFTRRDSTITVILFILYSLPSFWVAMLLMYFLGGVGGSTTLHNLFDSMFTRIGIADWGAIRWLLEHVLTFDWFPIYGFGSENSESLPFGKWLLDRLWHFCLPVFCMTYAGFATISRYARAGLIETVRQDYIRTAKAYGFSNKIVIYKYALRNSLIPLITILGTLIPSMIAGSVIIESIFSLPGMGKLFYESILSRDYPMIMGVFSITAVLTLVGLIISDILYAMTDPRIKFE